MTVELHSEDTNAGSEFVWGATAIGAVIGAEASKTFFLLKTKQIPARKVGGRWVASRDRLREFLLEDKEAA